MKPSGLFSSEIAFHACHPEQEPEVELKGQELELAEGLNPKVLTLFKLGRHAAHLGLKELGCADGVVGRGPKREPLWPEGYVGTIAHTEGWALAAVGRERQVWGLGVDIEDRERDFRYDISEKIATPGERAWIDEIPELKRQRTLEIFSAKEATFKAFFPLERVFLNFLDAEFSPQEGGLKGVLHKSAGRHWPVGFSFDVLQSGWKGYFVSALTLAKT